MTDTTTTTTTTKTDEYALNVKLTLKPEKTKDFLKIIQYDQQQTLQTEPGALQFVIGEDDETPNVFYLHEEYKSVEDFQYHKSTEHYAKWAKFVKDDEPFIAPPIVEFYHLFGPEESSKEQSHRPSPREGYCLTIKLKVNPKRRHDFLNAIAHNQKHSLISEAKCVSFQYGESVDTPNVFHLYEEYDGKDGFEEHRNTAHYEVYKKFAWSGDAFLERPLGQKYNSVV